MASPDGARPEEASEKERNKKSGRYYGKFVQSRINNLARKEEQENKKEEAVEVNTKNMEWREGRRIVELGLLADQLDACTVCSIPLKLSSCFKEQRYGLGSLLHILCNACDSVNVVATGKRHRIDGSTRGMGAWDVNSKLALAMVHTGLGPYQTCNFVSVLNIPPANPKTLKKREREVGPNCEESAIISCDCAAEEEMSASRTDDDDDNYPKIDVSFDGAWHKRGCGKNYNSKTGHATVIGKKTGKCIAFGVKSKDCRKCLFVDEKGDAGHPNCRKNYDGSSKSMESTLAVELVQGLQDKGCKIATFTGDDDTTTISKLKDKVDIGIKKISDKNHCRKNISDSLFKLQGKHKKLTNTVISYLLKDISYAIAQNKENETALANNLKAIIPHSFGNHDLCDTQWCGYLKDPLNYSHQTLPYGKDLTGDDLFKDLTALFSMYANNASKLCRLGSSQANESMNQIISTKAPKSKHFGGSESIFYRVSAGVLQKNEKRAYLEQVNIRSNLSPGKHTQTHSLRLDRKRKLEQQSARTREAKRRRIQNKSSNKRTINAKEIREGTTYKSGIGLSHQDTSIPDVEIPPPTKHLQTQATKDTTGPRVFFDLETTGLERDADIVQLAATTGTTQFARYILPAKQISKQASAVTNLYKKNGRLFHAGVEVDTSKKEDVLQDFLQWIPENAVLVGHNIKSFDSRVLLHHVIQCNMLDNLKKKSVTFVDTLPLLKDLLPQRKERKMSFRQSELVADILKDQYEAHDALEDVTALHRLLAHLDVNEEYFQKHQFSINFIHEALLTTKRAQTFHGMEKVVTKATIHKLASSGLEMSHLLLAFQRGGSNALEAVLTENVAGKPRVTKNKRILHAIDNFVQELVA